MGVNWKGLLGSVAPTLVKALGLGGGPAGAAVTVLSRALLGHEKGSEDDVAEAIAAGASPEQIEKIQAAERDFALAMLDRAVALERIEADDRASARAREVALRDRMPALLAIVLTVSLVGTIGLLATRAVPAENREPFLILLGALSTAWTGAMSYYHGSSSSSRAKDVVLGRVAGGR